MKEEIKKVMAHIGSIKTKKKARSSRKNGKKGGRPKKKGYKQKHNSE